MLILGLKGSPRKKSNTSFLLSSFLSEAEKKGAQTIILDVPKMNIKPCMGCGHCEKKGFCVIGNDDMNATVYPLLRQANLIVMSTPIYFYNATAQLKTMIDRSQALWSRRYKLNLSDPGANTRKGFLLSVGATRGKNLFDGVELTAKYFYDAVGAKFTGTLKYWQIEDTGEIEKQPQILSDVQWEADRLTSPLASRKKIMFACRENACRSQMAGAFARHLFGDKVDALTCGSSPAKQVNPQMIQVMAEKGLDMAFITPKSMDLALSQDTPDIMVTMGCGEACPFIPGAKRIDWDLPDPSEKPIDFMRDIRDRIEQQVKNLIEDL